MKPVSGVCMLTYLRSLLALTRSYQEDKSPAMARDAWSLLSVTGAPGHPGAPSLMRQGRGTWPRLAFYLQSPHTSASQALR